MLLGILNNCMIYPVILSGEILGIFWSTEGCSEDRRPTTDLNSYSDSRANGFTLLGYREDELCMSITTSSFSCTGIIPSSYPGTILVSISALSTRLTRSESRRARSIMGALRILMASATDIANQIS